MRYFLLRLKYIVTSLLIAFLLTQSAYVRAQDRCSTMDLLNMRFTRQPALKIMFDQRELRLKQAIRQRNVTGKSLKTTANVTIPVVFHVVSNRQSLITDEQILAQLDTINADYAGINGSASRVPSHFRALFGQSGIQFCLAQRTPNETPTTGIERYPTSRANFDYTTNLVKHAETGGATAWDTDRYLNIWICDLSGGTLGYATFPDDGVPDEQGVVIDFGSLPGGNVAGYNAGKTLTHELGHFFNLYHIWGDDNGSCNGTDQVDDTPNQGNSTGACPTGIQTDNCTQTAPGIMYQNYMDYTSDNCLIMFTKGQVVRMDESFNLSRLSLASSDACTPLNLKNKDASLKAITRPDQRICANSLTPQVVLENRGKETLTSVNFNAVIDNGTVQTFRWTGSLATFEETTVNLGALSTVEGNHILTITTSNPNGAADENTANDEQTLTFIYYEPFAAPVVESFESLFPPQGWDIVNEDAGTTWEKTTTAAKTGAASVKISNFGNEAIGERDYLRSPTVNIAGTDSAYVSFQLAAATYTNSTVEGNVWDTLQVMVSTDCGQTYTSVYKKWGPSLVTRTAATRTAFRPAANEWRSEEINITSFINQGEVLIAFVNSNGNENDIFLDDINIRTVTINPNLKEAGFLVTPNPTSGKVSVQFYPRPEGLRSVSIYNVSGQKIAEQRIAGEVSSNVYDFDLTNYASGLYIVKAEFTDRVLTKKIVKN
ncbi:M43 family zinc metalloprotease [Dyadobacter chenhuakuii]|uniref:M43 family zinc metalloprotease n=1 Tax=Dyadobacter chenhuakuii TaxID=2909339 RepID=A0ABY4XQE5_9BACT|nr:M43 family zinc metalloprotease [Dyadobacter chenhuakuii]MCF2493383.1 choice-of-anchor J domain-containing protein [Dyadobacter chenhuakuii]USJ32340.1 M43 family zinc metalloprotease [Dyadobacter chenhuakuii]